MTNSQENRYVGPVINNSEVGEAILEAVYVDNADRKINIVKHTSYTRIQVEKECVIVFDTVADFLGRDVTRTDIESNMPALEGFIRVEHDRMRFIATTE